MSFSCVVKTQRRWSNKIYKTELTKTRYNNQVLGTYRVDPQRAGLTLLQKEATIGHDRSRSWFDLGRDPPWMSSEGRGVAFMLSD